MKEEDDNAIGNIFDAFDEADISQDSGGQIDHSAADEISLPENESDNFASSLNDELSIDIDPEKNNLEYQDENQKAEEMPQVLSTVDSQKDDVQPFDVQKIQADKAMSQGRKPRSLNKQGILYIILGAITFIIVFGLFIFPLLTQKRQKIKENAKKQATANEHIDYYAIAYNQDSQPKKSPHENQEKMTRDSPSLEEDGLPPINPKYTGKKDNNVYVSGVSSAAKMIPDTSEDALQAKSINGIKGISSTRQNYLTQPPINEQKSISPASSAAQQNGYMQKLSDKNAYTNQLLSQYANAQNSYAMQNDQSGKYNFFSQGRGEVSGSYIPLNAIWQGTIFTAILTSNISTDLPGECTAVITKNVYSSQDGSLLLIPQNSKLFGSYNSSISYSQSRVQIGWHTLIRPDGFQVSLGNMNTTDSQGASGLKGFINDHPFQYLKALALMSAFSIGTMELKTFGANTPNNQYVQQLMNDSLVISNRLGEKLLDRALDVQPTITIKKNTHINIVANTNLVLPPFEMFEVTQPYRKQ